MSLQSLEGDPELLFAEANEDLNGLHFVASVVVLLNPLEHERLEVVEVRHHGSLTD